MNGIRLNPNSINKIETIISLLSIFLNDDNPPIQNNAPTIYLILFFIYSTPQHKVITTN